jgi:hypothetical protein
MVICIESITALNIKFKKGTGGPVGPKVLQVRTD